MRARHLLACATIALLVAVPGHADPFDALPELCRSLQQDGWTLPSDVAKLDPDASIEMRLPGIMYLCTLGRELPANDRGHAPDLGALLSASSDDAGVTLSADWFCAADRGPALAALADAMTGVAASLHVELPDGLAAAVREGRRYESTHEGIRFAATPVDVDPDACANVEPGDIGALLGKIDVSIGRAK